MLTVSALALVLVLAAAAPAGAAGGGMKASDLATCSALDTGNFRWGALKNRRDAERGSDDFAAALRKEIAADRLLPRRGWFVLRRSVEGKRRVVVFASGSLSTLSAATFVRHTSGSVDVRGWGANIGCLPRRVTSTGAAGVGWSAVPSAPPMDVNAMSLHVAVDVYRCAGDPGVERVSVDRVTYRAKSIDVLLDERPGPDCDRPLFDPVYIDIALAQPIGSRALRDVSVIPGVDRFTAAQRAAIVRGADPLRTIVLGQRFTTFCHTSHLIVSEAEFKLIENPWLDRAEKCKLGTEAAPRF